MIALLALAFAVAGLAIWAVVAVGLLVAYRKLRPAVEPYLPLLGMTTPAALGADPPKPPPYG